jgi:hypothetical protein
MAYGYVHLPEEFVTLLQSNMQTSGSGYARLKRDYWQRPHFQSVLSRATADLGNRQSFEQLINTLGWLGLRDRLAAFFLEHQAKGYYPKSFTLESIEDILAFEDEVKSLNLNGYSRAFLIGFYLKMGHYEEQVAQGKPIQKNIALISQDVLDVLALAKTRVAQVDWLCLSLHYLIKFRGVDKVKKLIRGGGGYSSLKSELTPQQEFTMMKAFLAYGASIYHNEAFHNPVVE